MQETSHPSGMQELNWNKAVEKSLSNQWPQKRTKSSQLTEASNPANYIALQ